ncbi:MAG: hypothetical protein JXA71_13135 [Chitinispirillaceae bacterium]|nr:hypothetical protein [Chitinispirillaceae bacterium]
MDSFPGHRSGFLLAAAALALVFSIVASPFGAEPDTGNERAVETSFDNPFESSEVTGISRGQPVAGDTALPEREQAGRNPFGALHGSANGELKTNDPPFWYPLVVWQREMNEKLSATMKSLKEDFSVWRVLVIFLISLVYALGHTAGPGHGKVLLGTFFLTSDIKRRRRDALTAGMIVSLTHIGMAFLLSLILYLVLHSLSMGSQRDMAELSKRIGGVFVILTGLALMFITLFRNKISFLSLEKKRAEFDRYSLYTIAVLAGIVPCPLAWFVLVFSISFNMYLYGIISVLGMAIGAALTVAIASYLSIIGRDKAMGMISAEKMTTIGLWLRFAGGCILVGIGAVMVMPTQ